MKSKIRCMALLASSALSLFACGSGVEPESTINSDSQVATIGRSVTQEAQRTYYTCPGWKECVEEIFPGYPVIGMCVSDCMSDGSPGSKCVPLCNRIKSATEEYCAKEKCSR